LYGCIGDPALPSSLWLLLSIVPEITTA